MLARNNVRVNTYYSRTDTIPFGCTLGINVYDQYRMLQHIDRWSLSSEEALLKLTV